MPTKRYTEQINVRVEPGYRDDIRRAARAEGLTTGEFMRRAVIERARAALAAVGAKAAA